MIAERTAEQKRGARGSMAKVFGVPNQEFKRQRFSEFGNYLQELRKERGLSQQDVANLLGINMSTVSRIENAVVPPPERIIYEFSTALGLPTKDLYVLMLLGGKSPKQLNRKEAKTLAQTLISLEDQTT